MLVLNLSESSVCFFLFLFFFWFPIVLALEQLLKTKCLCYAYFWLSNWGRTPTNRFCSLGFVWECPFVNVISPGMTFYVSIYTERAMYRSVCIHFSAVAPFPASLCSHKSLAKRPVQQYTTSLIVFSDEYFALFSSWWINDKTQCSAHQKFSNDSGLHRSGVWHRYYDYLVPMYCFQNTCLTWHWHYKYINGDRDCCIYFTS